MIDDALDRDDGISSVRHRPLLSRLPAAVARARAAGRGPPAATRKTTGGSPACRRADREAVHRRARERREIDAAIAARRQDAARGVGDRDTLRRQRRAAVEDAASASSTVRSAAIEQPLRVSRLRPGAATYPSCRDLGRRPVLQRGADARRARTSEIAAALEPRGEPFEVIFVDDGSTGRQLRGRSKRLARRDAERARSCGCGATSARPPRSRPGSSTRRGDVDHHARRRPPGRPRRDPDDAREARRGLRPRQRLEGAAAAIRWHRRCLSQIFNGRHRAALAACAARPQLRPQSVSRRGRRRACASTASCTASSRCWRRRGFRVRRDGGQPPSARARALEIRARAVRARRFSTFSRSCSWAGSATGPLHLFGGLGLASSSRRLRRSPST